MHIHTTDDVLWAVVWYGCMPWVIVYGVADDGLRRVLRLFR